MIWDEPKQIHWVGPALLAVGLGTAARELSPGSWGWLVCGLGAMILGMAALAGLAWWVVYRCSIAYRDFREAQLMTPEGELAKALTGLSPESQGWLLERFRLSIERHLTADGEGVEKLGPTGVPISWVVGEYLPRCDNMAVCPTGTFGEGSLGRQYCQAVTRYLVDLGLALPFEGGNVAAKWAPGVTPAWLWGALGYEVGGEG